MLATKYKTNNERVETMNNCQKNIVRGTELTVTEPMFTGSYRNAKYAGDRQWQGVVVADKYGDQGKHWFTVQVTNSNHESIKVGGKVRRQGKNLYGHSEILGQPENIDQLTKLKAICKESDSTF